LALSATAICAGPDIAAAIGTDEPVDGGFWRTETSVRAIKFTAPWDELDATRYALPWFARV
jgi:hypothetical protein